MYIYIYIYIYVCYNGQNVFGHWLDAVQQKVNYIYVILKYQNYFLDTNPTYHSVNVTIL